MIKNLRFLPTLVLLVILENVSSTAQGQKDALDAVLVTASGDTVKAQVKPDRAERLSSYIQVFDPATGTFKRKTPRDIKYFRLGQDEYFAKKDKEGNSVFMMAVVRGEVSLFRHTYRRKKAGGYETEEQDYFEKKNQNLIPVPSGRKFRETMSEYFSDYPDLVQKIHSKEYTEANTEDIALDYNEWVKAGRPRKGPQLSQGPMLVQNIYEPNAPDLAVEFPLYGVYNFVNYPNLLKSVYRSDNGGVGFDVGVGLKIRLKRGFVMRTGFNFRDKGYKATGEKTPVQVAGDSTNFYYLSFQEKATLFYPGVYLNFGHEWKYFFLSGGLNLSPFSFFRGSYSYELTNFQGLIMAKETVNAARHSFLVHDLISTSAEPRNFNMQADVQFMFGGNFRIGDRIALKPCMQYTVPLVPLYFSSQYVQYGEGQKSMLNVSGYQLKVGLIVELGIH
ncbi:MAG: hypothetical protein N2110_04120 [Flavobacteriales bacterium]|nr:hypothetical protein [Flavobacteriales bacterium]